MHTDPAAPPRGRRIAFITLAIATAIGLVVACVVVPGIIPFTVPIIAVLLFAWIGDIFIGRDQTRRLTALAQDRPPVSICRFARSFDTRVVDTWIIRATFEELTRFLATPEGPFPLEASDRLVGDLGVDADDLDFVADSIADAARRSLDGAEGNPLYGRIETVRDLVMFLEHQPRMESGWPPGVGAA